MDNLNIKGIESDTPLPGKKKKKGRKKFTLQWRVMSHSPRRNLSGKSLTEWHTYNRYHTESARDQAYAALVKKDEDRSWFRREFRIEE